MNPKEGDIELIVASDDLRLVALSIIKNDVHFVRVFDDVVIRDHVAIFRDDESGAHRGLEMLLRNLPEAKVFIHAVGHRFLDFDRADVRDSRKNFFD